MDTVDMPTAYGSAVYAHHQAAWDASCVALLRAAGAVIPGKTVTTEFAMHAPGKTANPHNPTHTPGGSSSGSAASVAAEMVPLALGTQTAGSIIRPASFCGVVGYKPTHGDFSLAGIKMVSQTLDTLGGFARCVQDLVLLRATFMGSSPQATRATQDALETAARRLAASGAHVEEVTLPAEFDGLAKAHTNALVFEAVRCCAYERTQHHDQLREKTRQLVEPGVNVSYTHYQAALNLAATCRQKLPAIFAAREVLLVPSAPGEAPAGLESTGSPLFNRIWTLLHTPAISLPGLTGPQGLPVGVQVVGPIRADDRLLAVANWIHPRLV